MAEDIYQKIVFTSFDSIIGKIFIAAGSRCIFRLIINGSSEDFKSELKDFGRLSVVRDDIVLKPVVQALKQYFNGVHVDFKYKLCPLGSYFQKRVWDALLKNFKIIEYQRKGALFGNVCYYNLTP